MSLMKCSTKKARLEIVGDDPRPQVRERPTAGRARGDRLQHDVQIEPGAVAVQQRLADADHVRGDQDLVDHLGVLAGAGAALVDDRLAHRLPAGRERLDHWLVAADHDRQPGFLRADVAARDRRVDAVHALGFGRARRSRPPATVRWWSCRPGSCPASQPASAPSAPSITSRTSAGKPTM